MKLKSLKLFLPVALLFTPFMALAFDCTSYKNQFGTVVTNVTVFCGADSLFTYIFNILFGFTGAVAVIFIILGGYWFITSAGNEERAEKGRKTLINSILGLVVIILAATIVRIVVNTLSAGH